MVTSPGFASVGHKPYPFAIRDRAGVNGVFRPELTIRRVGRAMSWFFGQMGGILLPRIRTYICYEMIDTDT
jgi:hypothetical protein